VRPTFLIANRHVPSEYLHAIGVHSLERSAQEDTLLVLFNTAISNLVRKLSQLAVVGILKAMCRFYSVITLL